MRFPALAAALTVSLVAARSRRQQPPSRVDLLSVSKRIVDVVSPPGSRRIYYLDAGDSVWLFDRTARTSKRVSHLAGAQSLAISSTGDRLALGTEDAIFTVALDRATGLVAGTLSRISQVAGESPEFSPDGRRLAYVQVDTAGTERVMTAAVTGGPGRVLASIAVQPTIPPRMVSWSPDGRYVYFKALLRDTWEWTFFRVPSAGGDMERLAGSGGDGGIGLSPDGSRLLLGQARSRTRFVIADSIGHAQASVEVLVRSPGWSPSTAAINSWSTGATVLGTEVHGDGSLWMMPIAGGSRRLIDSTVDARQVAWSPDGRRFAVAALRGEHPLMLLFNGDGTGRREFALSDSVVGAYLVWSPDGRRIAFRVGRERGLQILDVSTGSIQAFMLSQGAVDKLEWLRDGSGVRYITSPAPPQAYRELRTLSLTGDDRLVRPLLTANDSAFTTATFVDDSTVYLIHRREGMLLSLRTGETRPTPAVRTLLRGPVTGARVLAQLDSSLVLLDLTHSVARTLPMQAEVDEDAMTYPLLLPDSIHVVIASMGNQNQRRIQVLDLSSGQTRDLVTLGPLSASAFAYARPYISASPDGKTLLYTEVRTVTGSIQEFDLARLLRR
jgi:Tol biopolymer transport system component